MSFLCCLTSEYSWALIAKGVSFNVRSCDDALVWASSLSSVRTIVFLENLVLVWFTRLLFPVLAWR